MENTTSKLKKKKKCLAPSKSHVLEVHPDKYGIFTTMIQYYSQDYGFTGYVIKDMYTSTYYVGHKVTCKETQAVKLPSKSAPQLGGITDGNVERFQRV